MSNLSDYKPQKPSKSSLMSTINTLQLFLIWWTGAKAKQLPEHLKKPYTGLGAMAMVSTTLATLGGYSFVLISIGSASGAVLGAILAGSFMWGMDRSVLGFAVKESSNGQQSNSSSKKHSKLGTWVKLGINIAFSSILTLPLSIHIQRGAVQKHNMNLITAQIEKLEGKIATKNNDIDILEATKQKIDENWRLGNHADGSINKAYVQDKEQARQAIIDAKAEKLDLATERKELREDYEAFERGDISKVSLSFPEQFYYVMSQARWSDNVLNFCFFIITALMGSGSVLIKTFVFGTDSYTKKLQGLEDTATSEEELKYVMNTSAQQIYYSLFNTDVMGERMKTKLERYQREFESEIERQAQWLTDARIEQMRQKVREQAASEGLDWDYSNRIDNGFSKGNSHKTRQKNEFNKHPSSNNKTGQSSNFDDPWLDKSARSSKNKVENQKNNVPKVGKYEDFMTLFNDSEANDNHKHN
jgi:hypothetical protein